MQRDASTSGRMTSARFCAQRFRQHQSLEARPDAAKEFCSLCAYNPFYRAFHLTFDTHPAHFRTSSLASNSSTSW